MISELRTIFTLDLVPLDEFNSLYACISNNFNSYGSKYLFFFE